MYAQTPDAWVLSQPTRYVVHVEWLLVEGCPNAVPTSVTLAQHCDNLRRGLQADIPNLSLRAGSCPESIKPGIYFISKSVEIANLD